MKLRRIAALFVCALIATTLVACGSQASSNESKKYVIATDTTFAPFEFADVNGDYQGIDIELLAAIAKDQGFEYELNAVGFDAAVQNLSSNQADGVIAGMSITDERKQTFDFSDPYYDSTVCCAVPVNSDIKSLDDLKGKNVALKTGTLSYDWAQSIKDQYGFTFSEFKKSPDMYENVSTGQSVACFEDTPVMRYTINQHVSTNGSEGKDFKIISEVDIDNEFASQYGFAVKKGQNAELLKMFNDGLANIKKSGEYDKIVEKYVKENA